MANLERVFENLSLFTQAYVLGGNERFDFGNSLFGVFRLVLWFLDISKDVTFLLTIYTIGILGIFAIIALYLIFIEKCFWKKVAILTCAMNIFPFSSSDYKLIHLMIPLFLFINSKEQNHEYDVLYTILFGLLMIPKNYRIISNVVNIGTFIDPLLMSLIILLILYSGLKSYLKLRKEQRKETKITTVPT
jgi:hypothetical protein